MAKIALITGASSGIGLELSHCFAKDGYHLVLVARQHEKLNQIAEILRKTYLIDVYSLQVDLSKSDAIEHICAYLNKNKLKIDALVNNAGFGDYGAFADTDWQKQEDMINVNIMSLIHLTHKMLPPMIDQKFGQILNVASTAAFQPGPYMSTYFATKAFVLSFSEAIATELRASGVTVTALCPGPTTTNFAHVANAEKNPMFKKGLPTANDVAVFGYKSLKEKKTVAVHGFTNNILTSVVRVLPKNVVRSVVAQMQKKK